MGVIASKRMKMGHTGLPGKDGDATSDIQMAPRSLATRYQALNGSDNFANSISPRGQHASEPLRNSSSFEELSCSSSTDFTEKNETKTMKSPSVVTLNSQDDRSIKSERADIAEQRAEVESNKETLDNSCGSVDETMPTSILNSFVSRGQSPSVPLLEGTKSDQGKHKMKPAKSTSSKGSIPEDRVSSTASSYQDSNSDKVELLSCDSFDKEDDSGVFDVAVVETHKPVSHTTLAYTNQKDHVTKSKTASAETLPSDLRSKNVAKSDDSDSDNSSSPVHASLRKQRKEFDFFDSDKNKNCKNNQKSVSKKMYKKSLSSNVVLRGRDLTPQEKVLQELRSEGIVKVEDLSVKFERRQYQGQSILQELRDKGILQSDGNQESADADASAYSSRPRYMPQRLTALNPRPNNQVQYSRLKAKDEEVDDLLDCIDMEVEKSDEDYLGSTGRKLLLDKKLAGKDTGESDENKDDDCNSTSDVSMEKTNMEKKLEELRKNIWLTEQRMLELDMDIA